MRHKPSPPPSEGGLWRERRDFLHVMGLTGALGMAAPLLARADAPPAPVTVSLSAIEPGQQVEVIWAGRKIYVRRRTPKEIAAARAVRLEELRDPQADEDRVQDPEWLVVIGQCTHAGCAPLAGL